MNFTPQQRRDIGRVLRVGRSQGASPREMLAAMMTVLVEAGGVDIAHGDRDSSGIFQQRPSQGWGPASESLETDAKQFFAAAKKANTGRGSAGQLAQRVQRSAYPDRYDARRKDALAALALDGGKAPRSGGTKQLPPEILQVLRQRPASVDPTKALSVVQRMLAGGDTLKGVMSQFALEQEAEAAAAAAAPLVDEIAVPRQPQEGGSPPSPKAKGVGGRLLELYFNGAGGVNVKNGKRVGKGFVDGHTNHVHAAAGPRSIQAIAKLARKMGLTVRELAPFDKVDPVHVNNSYHYRSQAGDFSGTPQQMAAFSKAVARLYGLR